MDPPGTEPGAETRAGDQQHGVGDGVSGDHQLQFTARRPQVGADGESRDVHDEHVEHRHERGGEHECEQRPGPVVSAGRFTEGTARNGCGTRSRPECVVMPLSLATLGYGCRVPVDAGTDSTWQGTGRASTMGDVTMGTAQRRRPELAAFLRNRRARVTPQDVGMPPGFRRRTPGLRREEVAQLSGVGVTWYTWLEQGRPINASAEVRDVDGAAHALLTKDPAP